MWWGGWWWWRWWKPNIGHNSNSTLGGVGLTLSGDQVGLEWRWSWELSWSLTIEQSVPIWSSMASFWVVFILDYTDGVAVPGLGHGPYLCVGVASNIILKDDVEKIYINTTCKYYVLWLWGFILNFHLLFKMSMKCHYQIREPCYQCWWLSGHSWDWAALPQLSSFSDLGQISQWSLAWQIHIHSLR